MFDLFGGCLLLLFAVCGVLCLDWLLEFGLIVFVFSFAVMGVVWFVLGLEQCVLPL